MIYNLCKEMLITHVARPHRPPVPPPRRETSALSSDFGEGGWRAAVRPNPNGGRSSPASHSDHIRGAGSVRSRPVFGQRHDVYVHVCACAPQHIFSQLILWLFVKTGSYDWPPRGLAYVRLRLAGPTYTQRGKEM